MFPLEQLLWILYISSMDTAYDCLFRIRFIRNCMLSIAKWRWNFTKRTDINWKCWTNLCRFQICTIDYPVWPLILPFCCVHISHRISLPIILFIVFKSRKEKNLLSDEEIELVFYVTIGTRIDQSFIVICQTTNHQFLYTHKNDCCYLSAETSVHLFSLPKPIKWMIK